MPNPISRYRRWLYRKLKDDLKLRREFETLFRGRRLGCWCAPAPCHGEVIAAVLNDHPTSKELDEYFEWWNEKIDEEWEKSAEA